MSVSVHIKNLQSQSSDEQNICEKNIRLNVNGKLLCQRSTNLLFLIVYKAPNTHKQHHVLNFPITQNRQRILLSDNITQIPLYALPQNADLQLNVTEALAWQRCWLPKYPPGTCSWLCHTKHKPSSSTELLEMVLYPGFPSIFFPNNSISHTPHLQTFQA